MALAWGLNGEQALYVGLFFLGLLIFIFVPLVSAVHRLWARLQGGEREDKQLQQRIERFVSRYPLASFRLYRTPAGARIMVTHQRFDPNDPWVAECFEALNADPVYARLCHHQRCFRARVSAKPWRIGITEPMRPRPGVWPISANQI